MQCDPIGKVNESTLIARAALGVRGLGAIAFCCVLVAGCETGRTSKSHAAWQHLSDDSTTSKPQPGPALSADHGQPPVPGSPTAAGPDGNQPADDSGARERHGNEHGEAAAPARQPAGMNGAR